jgi:hypothetical protein
VTRSVLEMETQGPARRDIEVPQYLAPRENGGYGLILHLDLSWRRDRAIGGSSAARMEPDKKFARSDKNEADS